MSHRRRFLNLLMSNELASVYYLRRLDLHSCHNNLFYPTPAAAANDPSAALFSCYVGKEVLKKLPPIWLPTPAQSFRPLPLSFGRSRHCAAALSETETVFFETDTVTDYITSCGGASANAFVHDAGGRCTASVPSLDAGVYFPICFSVTSAADLKHDTFYVMEELPRPEPVEKKKKAQFLALVRGSKERRLFHNDDDWRCHELPPPPYVADHGYRSTAVGCHAFVGAAGDVICISTAGIGTYFFDTASRKWSMAGNWALPFFGKIEHDRDLGIWVGFLDSNRNDEPYDPDRIEEAYRICASTDLFSAKERGRLMELRDTWWWQLRSQDCKYLEPPEGWYIDGPCWLVGLGSGKFCLVQFFQTRKEACSQCEHEDTDDKFAVFTGMEVMRCGSSGKDNGDEQAGDGSDKEDDEGDGELRIVFQKSKRYMLTGTEGTISYVF
ncbi:unnamed protein product [Urochloa humidicola]